MKEKEEKNWDLLNKLKEYEGKVIEYFYRGKYRQFLLIAVQTEEDVITIHDGRKYMGFVGEIRLDYVDGKNRDWFGFWTKRIERVLLTTPSPR